MYCHPAYRVSRPPAIRPTVAPPAPIPPQIPSALLRSAPSSNMFITIESAAGSTIAAPRPCTPRIAIRNESLVASAQASEAAVKMPSPSMTMRLRPSRSAARPPRSRKPPKVSAKAVTTHCRFVSEKWSLRPIVGSATLTIVRSTIVMKNETASTAKARQRCGTGSDLGSCAKAFTRPPIRGLSLSDGPRCESSPVSPSPDREQPRRRRAAVMHSANGKSREREDVAAAKAVALVARALDVELAREHDDERVLPQRLPAVESGAGLHVDDPARERRLSVRARRHVDVPGRARCERVRGKEGTDRFGPLVPGGCRRHRHARVFSEQRGEPIDVASVPGGHVALEQRTLRCVGHVGLGPVGATFRQMLPQRLARALQRAVRGDYGRVDHRRRLTGAPAEDVAQDQHRPLAWRQVLDRDQEGELDRLARDDRLMRSVVGVRDLVEQPVRVWLEPADLARRRRSGKRIGGSGDRGGARPPPGPFSA